MPKYYVPRCEATRLCATGTCAEGMGHRSGGERSRSRLNRRRGAQLTSVWSRPRKTPQLNWVVFQVAVALP